jgi:hypothetical protein
MMDIEWEKTVVDELDITSTELSAECLDNILTRMKGFRYLGVGHCDFFVDKVCGCTSHKVVGVLKIFQQN